MASLSDYELDVRNLVRDPNANFFTTANIDLWINKARSQVAIQGQCVRALPPSSGSLAGLNISAPGSGYTMATLTISSPDAIGAGYVTATGNVLVSGGSIISVNLTNPGSGYVNPPVVTITGDGVDAAVTGTLTPFLATVVDQDKYLYSTANALILPANPGFGEILGVMGVSVSWGSLKPTLDKMDFSALQAYYRSYPVFMNYPRVWAQYGQGINGSMYLYPVPATVNQMEWDCYCKTLDLTSSQTVDAIPYPWTEAVPFYAAYLAFLFAQRKNDASQMLSTYTQKMVEYRAFSTPGTIPSFYGDDG